MLWKPRGSHYDNFWRYFKGLQRKITPKFLWQNYFMGAWVNGSIILQNRNFCNQKLLLSCKVHIGFFGHYFKDDYEESSGKIFEVFSVSLIHRIHCNFILIHSIYLGFFCLIFFFDFNNVYICYCKISISIVSRNTWLGNTIIIFVI